MAKKTLLKIVQLIGERIGTDEIDTLGETIEVDEIVSILEMTYDEILDRRDWEFLRDRTLRMKAREVADTKIFNLAIPSTVTKLQCVKYIDDNGKFPELEYVTPCQFIERLDGRNPLEDNVTGIANDDGVILQIITDQPPTFYTSFDEDNLTFDAYDSVRGTGTQAGDSLILANVKPAMDFTDPTAKFPIPERMQTLLINEAMATAGVALRQVQDPRAERIARRQGIKLRELEPKTQRDLQVKVHGRRTRSNR